jgi:hypothetical protein
MPTPTPIATTSSTLAAPVTVTLNYSPIDHNFILTVKGATNVSYILKYFTRNDTPPIEQAITHGGKADEAKVFTATHLAGTESNGTKVLHDVSTGGLEVIAQTAEKKEARIYKTFTINEKGVIKVTDVTTETLASMVLGASSESAELTQPGPELRATPMAIPVRTTVPTTMTDTSAAEITPTSSMPSLEKMWPLAALLGVLLLLALAGVALQRRFGRQPTPIITPPTAVPPTPPPAPPGSPLPPTL